MLGDRIGFRKQLPELEALQRRVSMPLPSFRDAARHGDATSPKHGSVRSVLPALLSGSAPSGQRQPAARRRRARRCRRRVRRCHISASSRRCRRRRPRRDTAGRAAVALALQRLLHILDAVVEAVRRSGQYCKFGSFVSGVLLQRGFRLHVAKRRELTAVGMRACSVDTSASSA